MSYTDVLDTEELLTKNRESAEKNLAQIAFDLDYLRDQMTIPLQICISSCDTVFANMY